MFGFPDQGEGRERPQARDGGEAAPFPSYDSWDHPRTGDGKEISGSAPMAAWGQHTQHANGRDRAAWKPEPGSEVRTVPSPGYPTIAAALQPDGSRFGGPSNHHHQAGSATGGTLPRLVVRLLPGVYHEDLCINTAVVLVGADERELPTIRCSRPDGLRITGSEGSMCMLKNIRVCAELGGRALAIYGSSPLIDACELVGAGGEPARGAPAGVDIRGSLTRPVLRGCRISGHGGAGVSFGSESSGTLACCDIGRCGCGVWLDSGANPLVWRNTIAGHRGAGIVVRSSGRGRVVGNTILRNGAGGILVESRRSASTVLAQNRVWMNMGCDLRQSPAPRGVAASEVGAMLLGNIVGEQSESSRASGMELFAQWPKRVASNGRALVAAMRDAPRDRFVCIEIAGTIDLQEPLILDRPIVITAAEGQSAEIRGAVGALAVVVVVPGGESAALWRVSISLPDAAKVGAGTTCFLVTAGCPVAAECDLQAAGGTSGGIDGMLERHAVQTHAFKAEGEGVDPLLASCTLRGASGVGALLDRGASATLLRCEVCCCSQGGLRLGDGASVVLEACDISGNGHFGVTMGPRSRVAYAGRSSFSSNAAGSVWHTGNADESGRTAWDTNAAQDPSAPLRLWLDQCSLAHASNSTDVSAPAVVLGPDIAALLWESVFVENGTRSMPMRAEPSTHLVVAMNEPQSLDGRAGGKGFGRSSMIKGLQWLDVSGNEPPNQHRPQFGGFGSRPVRTPSHTPPRSPINQSRTPPNSPPRSPSLIYRALPSVYRSQAYRSMSHKAHRHESPSLSQTRGDEVQHAKSSLASGSNSDGNLPQSGAGAPSLPIDSKRSLGDTDPALAGQVAGAAVGAGGITSPSHKGAADVSPTASPNREDRHMAWLQSKMAAADFVGSEPNRRMLFELLGMLMAKERCPEALDPVGLGGIIKSGDNVMFRGHTGRWIGLKGSDIVCNKPDRQSASQFVVEAKSTDLRSNCFALFRFIEAMDATHGVEASAASATGGASAESGMSSAGSGGRNHRLGVSQNGDVRALQRREHRNVDMHMQFVVQLDSPGKIMSGMPIYLKSVALSKMIEVKGDKVRCRVQERGTLQRLVIEKVVDESDVPTPCPDMELSLAEKTWLLRRGVQFALLDKQHIASFLAGHKPGCKELLQSYTRMWEVEWRKEHAMSLGPAAAGSDGSPASAQSRTASPSDPSAKKEKAPRSTSRTRASTRDWLQELISGVSGDDKTNGDLFVAAMRSFFASALLLQQLEANPVQRVIEAFAEALVHDKGFLDAFSLSMLPEKERKTYRSSEEVIFGLCYTTLMLNTDAHNEQVSQKTWDAKKFVGAGKSCGVTGGLMMQIFKNITKEEL